MCLEVGLKNLNCTSLFQTSSLCLDIGENATSRVLYYILPYLTIWVDLWSQINFFFAVGEDNQSSSRNKEIRKRTSVILPAEVPLPSPGLEYTPLSDEHSQELIDSLSLAFYRHVSRFV